MGPSIQVDTAPIDLMKLRVPEAHWALIPKLVLLYGSKLSL